MRSPRKMPVSARGELGDFLRSRREHLTPKDVGLASGVRRRTPGLRREEVAALAGIGIDWYIRLEQGRSVSPSQQTVDALSRALRLSKAEHAHLELLAHTASARAFTRETVPPAIRHLVEGLVQPAYVTGRRWDLLAWNVAATKIFLDFGTLPEAERNILLYMLVNPRAKRLFGSKWESEAQRMVGQFRATHDLWAGDPAFTELVARFREGCPQFKSWWKKHDIRGNASGQKLLHLSKGVQRFEYSTLQSNDDPALKLVVYSRLP